MPRCIGNEMDSGVESSGFTDQKQQDAQPWAPAGFFTRGVGAKSTPLLLAFPEEWVRGSLPPENLETDIQFYAFWCIWLHSTDPLNAPDSQQYLQILINL